MEKIYDSLVFDNRKPDALFHHNQIIQPHYADMVKRWVHGEALTEKNKITLSNILIYYPDYIVQNNKMLEFIELIKLTLNREAFKNHKNPEKGLFLYTLIYLMFKTGETEKALIEIINVELVIVEYPLHGIEIFMDKQLENNLIDIFNSEKYDTISHKARYAKAYFEIISRIMDLKEMLGLEPIYDLNRFPLPQTNISDNICSFLRIDALDFFNKESYQRALKIYKILRLAKYELPGTLIHFVRVELSLGNIAQSEIYTAMAWRDRKNAAAYVVVRTLFMIIILNMIQSKPIQIWLSCLKQSLLKYNSVSTWDMENVIFKFENKLSSDDYKLLNGLLKWITIEEYSNDLNCSAIWENAEILTADKWPDYVI